MSKLNAVRNEQGIWINSKVFRESGEFYLKNGYYTPEPWESPGWFEFWEEERRRIVDGYTVGGVKITGNHYFYLNYCMIKKEEDLGGGISNKVTSFPDFWDGDYNYFWAREIARWGISCLLETNEAKLKFFELEKEEQLKQADILFKSLNLEIKIKPEDLFGGKNLIVGKSRRKGYSYKSAAVSGRNYITKPDSLTIFGAYEKKFLYPKGLFSMAKDNINFVNQATAFSMPSDYVYKQDHIKASYKEYVNGIETEKGYKSEIMAITFKDNADAARGKDAEDIFFEESGAFGVPGLLKKSYAASEDCVKAGSRQTGMITIFGTSGDMEGGTADYADMFERPKAFGLLPFTNIWDEDSEGQTCGFFHPIHWNMEGCYDDQGNSKQEMARSVENADRADLIDGGATSVEINRRMQEKPFGPREAFGSVSMNNFPVLELKAQQLRVKNENLQAIKSTPVEFFYDKDGSVKTKILLDGKAQPITSMENLPSNLTGCPLIYEFPVTGAPAGLYKIGYDPVRQDEGTSLASIIVFKSYHKGSYNYNIPVAEYVGRLETTEDIDQMALYFAEYYNTKVMYENEIPGTKNYFRRRKKLHRLAVQPDAVISKNVKKSKVSRVYGCHMNDQLKDAGERYVKDWLLSDLNFDEDGKRITPIQYIYSMRLLEELIRYNRKGNFDLTSALFMCKIQCHEEVLGKEYESDDQEKQDKMKKAYNIFRKNKKK